MWEGQTRQQACDSIVSMMKERSRKWFEVAVIALDTKVSNLFTPGFKFDHEEPCECRDTVAWALQCY